MENKEFYKTGKIYKIICNKTGLIYVGCTCKQLSQRLANHRSKYKQYLKNNKKYVTSYKVIENGDCSIVLLENYPCNNKEELNAWERFYIETIECVNKNIPTRTLKEYYDNNKDAILEQKKKYYDNNKDAIVEQKKKYYDNNKDVILEKYKQYYDNNKDALLEKHKQYYDKNKDALIEKQKQYYKNKKNFDAKNIENA